MAVQAFVSRANANWSGASYLPGAILVAAWLMRWRARRWLIAALAIQAVLAAVVPGRACCRRSSADSLGAANSLKRAARLVADRRGWSLRPRPRGGAGGLTAIAVNNRFLYYALAYYGRDYFGEPGAPPLTIWLLAAGAAEPGRDQRAADAGHGRARAGRRLRGLVATR